ncbi:hypothetical protein [Neptuniibacter sp. 1_MG-2023]|uniref:hypothetical protein n=1 Tax=Neptuniibacter sp. 1_MG-2023 TaxID=3062662 RepID=UPI0026E226EA|nr:hypothetical protein [Neptuniibacter sp. 1_MG-2023]MDO6592326.1 hypothetical protein [Neptuniibacter sp. 1_MG-2023]
MNMRISLLVFVVTVLITLLFGRHCSSFIDGQTDRHDVLSTQSIYADNGKASERGDCSS